MSAPRRPALVLAVDEPGLLDLLTQVFEARGFAVAIGATTRQALSHLEGERAFDLVVAAWEEAHPIGGEVYRWALQHRVDLRAKFLFIADDPPAELDRVVAGRCLTLRSDDVDDIVQVVETTMRRQKRASALPFEQAAWLDQDRPPVLLVDDDTIVLKVMAQMLDDVGFTVTACESGNAAIAHLEDGEFAVVVTDWYMPDGTGAELHAWLADQQPWMLDRLVILTGADPSDAEPVVGAVPVIPKGQDFATVLGLIASTAHQTRRAS